MAGEIVHLELPSSDFARSAEFYDKLFGWKTDGVQSGGHLLFELPGGVQGSWIRDALAQAPGPVPFVSVADVDKTLADAERHGGRVLVKRMQLASRGAFGLLADRDGNVIGVLAGKDKGKGTEGGASTRDLAEPAPVSGQPASKAKAVAKGGDKGSPKPAAKADAKVETKSDSKSDTKKSAPRKR